MSKYLSMITNSESSWIHHDTSKNSYWFNSVPDRDLFVPSFLCVFSKNKFWDFLKNFN